MQGLEYVAVVTIGEEVKVTINKSGTFERLEGWFISHSSFFFSFQLLIKMGYGKIEEIKKSFLFGKKRQL